MASKAQFHIEDAVQDYLKEGSDDANGCEAYFAGDVLDVNDPEGKRFLKGVVSGLVKIAKGINRDAHLNKRV